MQLEIIWSATIIAYFIARLAEHRVHSRNYRQLRDLGAEELIPSTMRRYYMLPVLFLPLGALEHLYLSWSWPSWLMLTGAMLACSGLALRLWAIQALGPLWSMRCLGLVGAPRRAQGPYQFLSHPEYFSRLIDVAGILLVLAAPLTAALYLLVAGGLAWRIASIESRQLSEIFVKMTDTRRQNYGSAGA